MIFDFLETKRHHVRSYKKQAPLQSTIDQALWKAWKTTPSKNNAMPYKVFVWRKQKDLDILYKIAAENNTSGDRSKKLYNPYFDHIKTAPFLLTIHQRVATPNKYYKRTMIKNDLWYEWSDKKYFKDALIGTTIEVGMFVANLTCYLLEEGIDVSYNGCFKHSAPEWQEAGLKQVRTKPLIMMSMGYVDKYRKEVMATNYQQEDIKPELKDVVEWKE